MNEPTKTIRMRTIRLAQVVSIFLLGVAAGAALIYLVQPPRVADSLAYELFLFTSDKPLREFKQQIAAMKQSQAGRIVWSGGDMVGNVQFAAPSGMLTRLNLALPDNSTPYTTLTGIQFDIRGEQVRKRVRMSMDLVIGNLEAGHEFDLGDGEFRVVELLGGEKDRRKWYYAIIAVEQAKAAPAGAVPPPRPAPVGGIEGR